MDGEIDHRIQLRNGLSIFVQQVLPPLNRLPLKEVLYRKGALWNDKPSMSAGGSPVTTGRLNLKQRPEIGCMRLGDLHHAMGQVNGAVTMPIVFDPNMSLSLTRTTMVVTSWMQACGSIAPCITCTQSLERACWLQTRTKSKGSWDSHVLQKPQNPRPCASATLNIRRRRSAQDRLLWLQAKSGDHAASNSFAMIGRIRQQCHSIYAY